MPLPDGKQARLMVITAHPVDAFDNTGGTCAEHIQNGDQVTALICTSGVNIHNEKLIDELRKPEAERDPAIVSEPPEEYAARKKREAEVSLGCFGITDVVVLPYDDGRYDVQAAMVADIEELICDRKPHIILQQDPRDSHSTFDDHAIVGVATSQAISRAGTPKYGSTRTPWRPVEVYLLNVYGVNTSLFGPDNTRPDLFVDVTKHYKAKVKAHQSIASQGQDVGWGQKRIEGIEGHCGIFASTSYAEAFQRVSIPVFTMLPINKKRYEDIQLSSAEQMKKNYQLLGAFVKEADGSYAWGIDPDKV